MGVLFDYFRAADDAAVVRLMEATDGGPVVIHGGESTADGVDAKGLDPVVIFGHLIGLIRDVEWSDELVSGDLVWPERPDAGAMVVSLGAPARDTLASVDDTRLPDLAARWATIEELAPASPDLVERLREAAAEMVALARRAQAAGDELYCWMSV